MDWGMLLVINYLELSLAHHGQHLKNIHQWIELMLVH